MKKLQQKITFVFLIAIAISSIACKKDDPKNDTQNGGNNTEKKGTYTIDGVVFSGETEIQTFTNDNYSILCVQDDPYSFLQITFHSKEEAEKGGTFKVDDEIINTPSGEVHITIDGLTYENDGNFEIKVANNKITIDNVKLTQTGGGSKKKIINTASIDF